MFKFLVALDDRIEVPVSFVGPKSFRKDVKERSFVVCLSRRFRVDCFLFLQTDGSLDCTRLLKEFFGLYFGMTEDEQVRPDVQVFVASQHHNFSSYHPCGDDIPFHLLYNDDDLEYDDECKQETARDDAGEVVLRGVVQVISAEFRECVAANFFRPPKPKRSARYARPFTSRIQQPNKPQIDIEREVRTPRKKSSMLELPASIVNSVATALKNKIQPAQGIRNAGLEYNNSTRGQWARMKFVCMLMVEEDYQVQRLLIAPHKGDTSLCSLGSDKTVGDILNSMDKTLRDAFAYVFVVKKAEDK